MNSSRLYFAYADNMNEEVVRDICPGVSFEGVAELPGFRITFNSEGKATVIEDPAASVWGVVWCLSMRDIHLLDSKEIESLGVFEKQTQEVRFIDGRTAEAFIYIAKIGNKPKFNQKLTDLIIEQAYYWSLPAEYVELLKGFREQNQ